MKYDWGTGGSGALSGATTGAMVGGPVGALAGGGLGALMGFAGGQDKMKKIKTLTKAQESLLNQLMQMIDSSGLSAGYGQGINLQRQLMDPSSQAVSQFTQPYMDQFTNQIVPQLAERFAGRGALGGGLSSSGFGQALGTAGSTLQNQLAALKAGLGQSAAQNLMNQYGQMAGMGLSAQPFGYAKPQLSGAQGFLQGYMGAGMPGLSNASNSLSNAYQQYMPIIGNV